MCDLSLVSDIPDLCENDPKSAIPTLPGFTIPANQCFSSFMQSLPARICDQYNLHGVSSHSNRLGPELLNNPRVLAHIYIRQGKTAGPNTQQRQTVNPDKRFCRSPSCTSSCLNWPEQGPRSLPPGLLASSGQQTCVLHAKGTSTMSEAACEIRFLCRIRKFSSAGENNGHVTRCLGVCSGVCGCIVSGVGSVLCWDTAAGDSGCGQVLLSPSLLLLLSSIESALSSLCL